MYEHITTVSQDDVSLLMFFLKETKFTPTIEISEKINVLISNLLEQLQSAIFKYNEQQRKQKEIEKKEQQQQRTEINNIENTESNIQIRHKRIIEKRKLNGNWTDFGYHINCPHCKYDINHKTNFIDNKPVTNVEDPKTLRYNDLCNSDGKIRLNGNNHLIKEFLKMHKLVSKVSFEIKHEEYRLISEWASKLPDNMPKTLTLSVK